MKSGEKGRETVWVDKYVVVSPPLHRRCIITTSWVDGTTIAYRSFANQ